jgi:hypothetical protein
MEKEYSIKGRDIINGKKILLTAEADIQDCIVVDGLIILLLFPENSSNDRNIECYQQDGSFKWKIPEPDKIHFRNYYTSIYLSASKELMAYNINGGEVTINKEKGYIIDKHLIK